MSTPTIDPCAKCRERAELCDSVTVDGVKQPRFCKQCLLNAVRTGDYEVTAVDWLTQIIALGDTASYIRLQQQCGMTDEQNTPTEATGDDK